MSANDIIRDRHNNRAYKEWQWKNKVSGADPVPTSKPATDAYREGWERIWGKKEQDDVH